MGGGSSKDEDDIENSLRPIPVDKRYDVTYLSDLLTDVIPDENDTGKIEDISKNDIGMAFIACKALKNLSDSYAYSEEIVNTECLSTLLKIAFYQPETKEEYESENSNEDIRRDTPESSGPLGLIKKCRECLFYMLEESSAPQLFRRAILPLLPKVEKEVMPDVTMETGDESEDSIIVVFKKVCALAYEGDSTRHLL